ncbi:glycosyltransferase family 4 protein [Chloroflexota bacterium]
MAHVCVLSSVHDALDNRVFYREAQSLQRAGHEVTLIAVHDCDETKDGVRIIGLPRVRRLQRPRLWRTLLRHAQESRADIYHFHDPELLLVTPWVRWRTGSPTIYDIHEAYSEFIQVKDYMPGWLRYPVAWVFRWLEPLLARLQSALVFTDDQIAAAFTRLDCPKATLYNFPGRSLVDQGVAATENLERRNATILYLGGLERNRGSELMLEAFANVHRQVPAARLLIVGHFMPSQLEDEVREDAARRGLENAVEITGRVPFEEIGQYLRRAAVGWVPWQPVPKNKKNTPTKLFEYMAYALPIVSSDLPSTQPFVRAGENGFLVIADDPDAHTRAIVRLLGQPDEAARMGRAGQELVQTTWNWDKMEERLLGLYQTLLS